MKSKFWDASGLAFSGDPSSPKPGDKFPVKVGERWYDTVIDDQGVQRFVSNGPVNALVEHSGKMFEEFWMKQRIPNHPCVFGLNELAVELQRGKWTVEEHIHFYTMFGYSVSGFSTLSFVQQVPIINPLWKDTVTLDGYTVVKTTGKHKGRWIIASVCGDRGFTTLFNVNGFKAIIVQLGDDMTWNIVADSPSDEKCFPEIEPFDSWMDAVTFLNEQSADARPQ